MIKKMKQMLLKAMAVLVGLAMSVSLVSCGDDEEKDEPQNPESDVTSIVEVKYHVELGQGYWDFFDITVEYTAEDGSVETKTITQEWSESYEVSLAKAADTYVFKVTALTKQNHPAVVDGEYYDLSTNVNATVSGKNQAGKYDPEFGLSGSNVGNWEATARELNSRLSRPYNTILDFDCDTKK